MKKVIALMALMAMTTMGLSAQNAQDQERKRMTKEEMVQRRTDFMAQQYGLSDSQKKQLLELNTKYADVMPMMGPRPGGMRGQTGGQTGQMRQQGPPPAGNGNGEMRRGGGHRPGGRDHFDPEKMKEYESGLAQIMDKNQFAKYEENKKTHMQHREKAEKDDSK